jgi:hypothetical protein
MSNPSADSTPNPTPNIVRLPDVCIRGMRFKVLVVNGTRIEEYRGPAPKRRARRSK